MIPITKSATITTTVPAVAGLNLQDAAVLDAAEKWWRSLTPLHFSESDHLEHPAINAVTDAEKELARAVAAALVAKSRDVMTVEKTSVTSPDLRMAPTKQTTGTIVVRIVPRDFVALDRGKSSGN